MMDEAGLRKRIAKNYELPDPKIAFQQEFRQLVYQIGDGQIEGDPVRLCRVLCAAEVRLHMGQPAKLSCD